MRSLLTLVTTICCALAPAWSQETKNGAARWPQFRGPGGKGVARAGMKLPVEFGPSKNLLWKTPLPRGHSSACVWDDRIFVTGFDKAANRLETFCLDRHSGKVLWRGTAPTNKIEKVHQINSPASPTPATDGERIYVFFGSYGLICYDRDGQTRWQRPLPPIDLSWGSATSPVVAGEFVLLNGSHKGNMALLAFNRRTGELIWQKERPKGMSPWPGVWSTPVVWRQGGAGEVIVVGGDRVAAYNLADGKERWHVHGLQPVSNSTPTVGAGMVFLTLTNPVGDPQNLVTLPTFDDLLKKYDKNKDGKIGKDEIPADFALVDRGRPDKIGNFGFLREALPRFDKDKDGALNRQEWADLVAFHAKFAPNIQLTAVAVRLGGQGDVTQTHLAWKETKGVPEVPSPLYYQNRVYLVSERGFVSCRDARTGKPLYRKRLEAPGICYSSPVAGDGKIYTATDAGVIVVFKAGDRFEVLARNELGEPILATPALVDGKIYVRTAGHLCAFGEK